MIEFIGAHQLNLMILICGACLAMTIMLSMTKFLSASRKTILIAMELIAFFLLWFDRYAYIYTGDTSVIGYIMVRVSNFIVYFLTVGMILGFNLYLTDLLKSEGGLKDVPVSLKIVQIMAVIELILIILNTRVNFFYYFDANNVYHRGTGFYAAYIIPVLCPVIQFITVYYYRKCFSRIIFISLNLYLIIPVVCGLIQIKTYGISLINMALVTVSASLYMFTYLDINETVQKTHKNEMEGLTEDKESMKRLFHQTATALAKAIEKKDDYSVGHSEQVASMSRKLAEMKGKNESECDKVYYAGLLHDVGMIGIPDSVLMKIGRYTEEEYEIIKRKPVIGGEILGSITDYPYLSEGAHYNHERYDGTGYPEGLKGEGIPEIARIVAVADAYVTMTHKNRYKEASPDYVIRETFIENAGTQFDPDYASLMVKIIDSENEEKNNREKNVVETTITNIGYRDAVTMGITVDDNEIDITFNCSKADESLDGFSSPSLIIFESYDNRVHSEAKAIKAYGYEEYAELWFDTPGIITAAREIKETVLGSIKSERPGEYQITAGRYEDHIRLVLTSPDGSREVVVALPGGYKDVCIGLTGENSILDNITVTKTGKVINEADIDRIAPVINYTNRMESDIPNVQIDRKCSAYTQGVLIGRRTKLKFHTRSLPEADFVWNCPFVVLYSSKDGQVEGPEYEEYALIKLNGEIEENNPNITNKFIMRKKETFRGWDYWKDSNKEGMECEVNIERRGRRIITASDNLGIEIENTTELDDNSKAVYVALTGDMCALTDIRLK